MKELYLKKYEFNIAIFMDELNKIILKKGGKLANQWYYTQYTNHTEQTKIHNRYLLEGCFDYEKETAEKYKDKNIPIEYITNSNLSYTAFILNDIYYYIQIDENPFFDDHMQKIKIEKITGKNYQYISYNNHYMEKVSEELKNIYWKLYNYLTLRQIKNLAKKAFELIKNQNFSNIVTNRQRVNNYYNNSYHYENIPEKRTSYYFIKEG